MTKENRFTFPGAEGTPIAAYHWRGDHSPHAALIVAHGMGEHAGRYRAGLAELIHDGVDVYAPDHRGHGATASGQLGDLGSIGFSGLVSDLAILTRHVRDRHPDLPVILLGHSMGSYAVQLFVLDHSDLIDGIALSGSSALDVIAKASAQIGDQEGFEALNVPFHPARTAFDWLSRDGDQVDAYVEDPLCGFGLTPSSFELLLANAGRLSDLRVLGDIPKDLPIYIFSGLADPLIVLLDALDPVIERYGVLDCLYQSTCTEKRATSF